MFAKFASAGGRIFLVTSSALVASAGSYALIKIMAHRSRKQKQEIRRPEKWVKVGQILKLLIYPIKSCAGIEVAEAKLTPLGLQSSSAKFLLDRAFVVVNSQGAFQTQRQFPQLALVHVEITDDDKLILSSQEKGSVTCDLNNLSPAKQSIRVWTDYFKSNDILDLGDDIAQWIDSFLGAAGYRIFYHAKGSTGRAMTNVHKKFPLFVPNDTGTFQDETSYLLMTVESIEAVNDKLEEKVSHRNFRPNFLVDGIPEPFSEDSWSFVRIGDRHNGPILKAAMPCCRCRLTTVNQDTGVFNAEGQPLKTILAMKRQVADDKTTELVKNQAVLGNHFGLYEGQDVVVKAGDVIYMALK